MPALWFLLAVVQTMLAVLAFDVPRSTSADLDTLNGFACQAFANHAYFKLDNVQ